jgi:hypothetical protein
MVANKIAAEFESWGLMGHSFNTVEGWAQDGRISWDAYECYRFFWELGGFKFSVTYPVTYNVGDVLVFRRVFGLLGLGESLALDGERDLVLVDDDGARVDWFAVDDTAGAVAYEARLHAAYTRLVLEGAESAVARAAWDAYQTIVDNRLAVFGFRRSPGGRKIISGIPA